MCMRVCENYLENVATSIPMWLFENATRKPQWLFKIYF